jgi:hypothetical protein
MSPWFRKLRLAAIATMAALVSCTAFAQSPVSKDAPPTAQGASERTTKAPPPQIKWSRLPEVQKKALAPLEKDWDSLGGVQQRRLLDSARAYPRLAPIQQERYTERIREWAALTPEQRAKARDKYRDLNSLPPEKQHELRERWNERAQQRAAAPQDSRPGAPQ